MIYYLYCDFAGIGFSVLAPLVRPTPEVAAVKEPSKAGGMTTLSTLPDIPSVLAEGEGGSSSEMSTSDELTNRRPRTNIIRAMRRDSAASSCEKGLGGGKRPGGPAAKGNKRGAGRASSILRVGGLGGDQMASQRRSTVGAKHKHHHHHHHGRDSVITGVGGVSSEAATGGANTTVTGGDSTSEDAGDHKAMNITGYDDDGEGFVLYSGLESLNSSTVANIAKGVARASREKAGALQYGSNRSAIPASEAEIFALRTRRAAESRAATFARQRLLASLGVGKRRTAALGDRSDNFPHSRPSSPKRDVHMYT